jgi:hypothetical protein
MISQIAVDEGNAEVDTAALYAQVAVDRAELAGYIRKELRHQSQISLGSVIAAHPLRQGLTELLAYFQVAVEWPGTVVDEQSREQVTWQAGDGVTRRATMPRIILLRS